MTLIDTWPADATGFGVMKIDADQIEKAESIMLKIVQYLTDFLVGECGVATSAAC